MAGYLDRLVERALGIAPGDRMLARAPAPTIVSDGDLVEEVEHRWATAPDNARRSSPLPSTVVEHVREVIRPTITQVLAPERAHALSIIEREVAVPAPASEQTVPIVANAAEMPVGNEPAPAVSILTNTSRVERIESHLETERVEVLSPTIERELPPIHEHTLVEVRPDVAPAVVPARADDVVEAAAIPPIVVTPRPAAPLPPPVVERDEAPRVVIGRVTVEIVSPAPVVPNRTVVVRSAPAAPTTPHVDVLRRGFGLGQG